MKQLSLTEWMQWQSVPSAIGSVTHSRRTQHLVELLEFIELHSGRNDGEHDCYDAEMITFFDEDDVVKPDIQKDYLSDGIDEHPLNQRERKKCRSRKVRKKRKRLSFESDESDSEQQNNINVENDTADYYNGHEAHLRKTLQEQSKVKDNKVKSKTKRNSKGKKRRSSEVNFHQLFADEGSDEDFDISLHSKSVFDAPQSRINLCSSPAPTIISLSIQNENDLVQSKGNVKCSPFAQDPEKSSFLLEGQQGKILRESTSASLQNKTPRKQGEGGGNRDSDEDLVNLLPLVFPEKTNCVSTRKNHFPVPVDGVIPAPPSLDSLANISLVSLDTSHENLESGISLESDIKRFDAQNNDSEKRNDIINGDNDLMLSECLLESSEENTDVEFACSEKQNCEMIERELPVRKVGSTTISEKLQNDLMPLRTESNELNCGNKIFHQDDYSIGFSEEIVCGTPAHKLEICEKDFDMGDPFSLSGISDEERFEKQSQSSVNKSSYFCDESPEIDSSAPIPSLRTRLNAQILRMDDTTSGFDKKETDTSNDLGTRKTSEKRTSFSKTDITRTISKLNVFKRDLKENISAIVSPTDNCTGVQEACKQQKASVSLPVLPNLNPISISQKGYEVKSNGERTNMMLTEEGNFDAIRNIDCASASVKQDLSSPKRNDLNPKPDGSRLKLNSSSKGNAFKNGNYKKLKNFNIKNGTGSLEKNKIETFNGNNEDKILHDEAFVEKGVKDTSKSVRKIQALSEESPDSKTSKLKIECGSVVAVMESEDESEEDQELPIMYARSRKKRRNPFSSPCSQEEKDLKEKVADHRCFNFERIQVGSTSEDEFEVKAKGMLIAILAKYFKCYRFIFGS